MRQYTWDIRAHVRRQPYVFGFGFTNQNQNQNQNQIKSNHHCMFRLALHLHSRTSEFKRNSNICANAFLSLCLRDSLLFTHECSTIWPCTLSQEQGTSSLIELPTKVKPLDNPHHSRKTMRASYSNSLLYTPKNDCISSGRVMSAR